MDKENNHSSNPHDLCGRFKLREKRLKDQYVKYIRKKTYHKLLLQYIDAKKHTWFKS
jgi:hypothetical protein